MKNKLRFRLRNATDGENGGGGPAPVVPAAPPAGGENPPGNDLGFPADTPVTEMTEKEQAAYWKDKARKHEKRARPKDFDQITEDAEKWRAQQQQNLTPDQQAVNTARDAGRREGAETLLHDAVRASLKAQRPHMTIEQLDEFLEDVALANFLGSDGRLDTDRVERLAGKLAVDPKQDGDTPPAAPANGGQVLGQVLSQTGQPPVGNAGSVQEHREREASRYAPKNPK